MKNNWIGEALMLYEDCEKLGFNIEWVERKLGECNRIDLYKAVIEKVRNKPEHKGLLTHYQARLKDILNQLIQEYCLQ